MSTGMSDKLLSGRPPRWRAKDKVRALLLVNGGQIPRRAALKLWDISEEEWMSWQGLYRRHGEHGLRATKVQAYRRGKEP